ncbi:SUN domain-containing protein 1-like isoform X8 [Betta splendens]|uniref:SUN domain-containing protein 1-like isoform X8 n=1 Tax=Betta splendens TaxID=158456 RepID=A0A6P7N775_BETSP|nr:SUN domain-containing protein 1-like isoform X8 [Betta splendens]
MQEELKQRGMTMDFSQLHTYTPPQCAPENTGYTYSLSSSYSTAALEFEQEHQIAPVYESPRMSRRSLRLQASAGHYGNESLADMSQNHSSTYTSTRRETRTLRSRKQQQSNLNSLSLSLSQVATPRKTLSFSAVSTPIASSNLEESSAHNAASDASLNTFTVAQPHLRQRTITSTTTTTTSTFVDGHWGRSSIADHSLSINGDASTSKSHATSVNGYICHDCSLHSQKDSFITQSSSSASQAAEAATVSLSSSSSPFTSIYSRDRSQKNKTGVLMSVCNTCVRYSKKVLAPVVSLVTVVFSSVLWLGSRVRSSPTKAHSSFCGSMNVKDLVTEDASHLKLNGSLCSCLLQPGYCVVRVGKAVGSGVGTVAKTLLSLLWMLLTAPVKAGKGLLWFFASGWYRLVSLMSILNVFFLTRCLPKLWKLLLLLLPLLLLLALWLWGPSTAAFLAYLPAINLTEWRPASPLTLLANFVPDSAPVIDSIPAPETPLERTPATPVSEAPAVYPPVAIPSVDLERLERVESQLALLWDRVQQGDQKQEKRHGDILGLYSTLRDQLHTQADRESLELWISSLLEQRLGVLRSELEQESTQRAQSAEQNSNRQEIQAARLAELELLLNALAAKTEAVQQKQHQYERKVEEKYSEVTSSAETAAVSVGVKQEDHDALLAEVQRLEVDLGKIRQDLQGVVGCRGKCEQLTTLQDTISAQVSSQVRKELQALFYGSAGSEGEQELPESFIHWLSQRYVSTSDLQAALASMELGILRNVSLQLEMNRAQTLGEAESQAKSIVQTVTSAVQHSAAVEGMTEEQVKLIVQNALKLYSQDRTGLVDYALESGGGSILSTRCSETYETKTALMSLFGLPLWYFSQSPRVVIQPDVYPGNCWAFKGSQGYLVIRLSLRILPTSFCVEHIPKSLSPTGNITSAPRNFTVYGLDDEYQEEGKLLGHYTYQEDGDSLQTFPVTEQNDKAFQIIEVRVLSNWGHPEYTCLYRFRVHGEPRPLSTNH